MPVWRLPRERLEPHVRYFTKRCMAKGATKRKATEWAWRVVRKGKRMPQSEGE